MNKVQKLLLAAYRLIKTPMAAADWLSRAPMTGDPREAVDFIREQVVSASAKDLPRVVGFWLRFYRLSRGLMATLEEAGLVLARDGKLPGWKVLAVRRRKLEPGVTHATLVTLFGAGVADAACPRTASFTLLEKAIKKVANKGEGAKERDRALVEITNAGGVVEAGVSERLVLEGDQPDDDNV